MNINNGFASNFAAFRLRSQAVIVDTTIFFLGPVVQNFVDSIFEEKPL